MRAGSATSPPDGVAAIKLLVFGAGGAIGSAVARQALDRGWDVVGTGRSVAAVDQPFAWLTLDPADEASLGRLADSAPYDAVCWAQGANLADSVGNFDLARHMELYRANCLSVLVSMAVLVARGWLAAAGARLVVVSSVWEARARQDKLSYTMTKAAIGGLVRSASIDLGDAGHLINAVLPGVLDTPMTAANLTAAQLAAVCEKTRHGRLPDLATVAETILFLCSRANGAITGQSVTVDLGMSNNCIV